MIYGTIKKVDCGTVTVRRFFLRALRHCALAALTWQAGCDAGIINSYIFLVVGNCVRKKDLM